jgi:hypothetical protein
MIHQFVRLLVQDWGTPKTKLYVEWSRKRNDVEPTGGVTDLYKKKNIYRRGNKVDHRFCCV